MEFDDINLNRSNQERNNEDQVINHNKDNVIINNANGNPEISVFTNCININFENINNSAIKDTGNVKNVILRKTNLLETTEGQININPIRNKLDPLMTAVAGNIDIWLITGTKTPHFPNTNFILMAVTHATDATLTLTVTAFWFVFAMTLDQV